MTRYVVVLLTMSDGFCREMRLFTNDSNGLSREPTEEDIERDIERISRYKDGSFKPGYPVVTWRFAGPQDEEVLRDRKHREARRDAGGVLIKDPEYVKILEERDRAIAIMKEEKVAAWERAKAQAKLEADDLERTR